ncbi:MAG: AAA family ATPase [Candidatus Aenigmarchaeota archaeon]|nr:AAA family ATPase [Candidatus Aenigmarchaeota archaeon]
MNKSILVTGVSGSGKSAICNELKKLGYRAYDIEEIHGLFNMINKSTGKITDLKDYDKHNLECIKQHDWICDKKKLQKLISKNVKKNVLNNVVFYCGTASNTDDLLTLFDKIILLKASKEIIRKRLSIRTSNDFGHTEEVQNWVFEWKEWWENHMVEKGAMTIDANHDLKEVVNDIVKKIKT